MFMRFSSALVASVLSVVTIGSAWAYCDSPLGCLPSMPSYGYQPQMPNYGYQPQYLPLDSPDTATAAYHSTVLRI